MLASLVVILLLALPQPLLAHGSIGVWGQGSWIEQPVQGGGEARGAVSAPSGNPGDGWQSCVAEILDAERRHGIPNNYLLAISLTESGRRTEGGSVAPWPWTVNAEGVGKYFSTKQQAIDWVEENKRAGKNSIDIGCMQVNLRWHPNAFSDLQSGFTPRVNVDYAARLLTSLRDSAGTWKEAIGRYHSHTEHLKQAYAGRVENNRRFIQAVKQELREAPGEALVAASSEAGRRSDPQHPEHPGAEGPGLSWTAWMTVARADGNRGGAFAEDLFKPIIPDYE